MGDVGGFCWGCADWGATGVSQRDVYDLRFFMFGRDELLHGFIIRSRVLILMTAGKYLCD